MQGAFSKVSQIRTFLLIIAIFEMLIVYLVYLNEFCI